MGAFRNSIVFYAAITAWNASWRLMITIASIVLLPLGFALTLIVSVGVPVGLVSHASIAVLLFPLSFFVHEFGHALVAILVNRHYGSNVELLGVGTFLRGSVVRWTVDPRTDAMVALVGPLLGFLTVAPSLLPDSGFLITFPFALLYLVHLGSLFPKQSDGEQIFAYLRGRTSRA